MTSSPQLLALLRAQLAAEPRLGGWRDDIDQYTSTAYSWALKALNTPGQAVDWYSNQLATSYRWMLTAYEQALESGSRNLQTIVGSLTNNMERALASVGRGAGAALEALVGASPADLLDRLLIGAAVVVATLAVVSFSPAGAALATRSPALLAAIKPRVTW